METIAGAPSAKSAVVAGQDADQDAVRHVRRLQERVKYCLLKLLVVKATGRSDLRLPNAPQVL